MCELQVLYTGYLDGGHKEAFEAGVDVQMYMDECHAMLSLMLATWPKDQPHEPGTPLLLPLLSLPIEDTMLPADPTLESRPPLCEVSSRAGLILFSTLPTMCSLV